MLKRFAILCALVSTLFLTAASYGAIPDQVSAPICMAFMFDADSDSDSDDDAAEQADCDKTSTGNPAWCDASDTNTKCTTKGDNATCKGCPANTDEATRQDPDGDGCCCDWGA